MDQMRNFGKFQFSREQELSYLTVGYPLKTG